MMSDDIAWAKAKRTIIAAVCVVLAAVTTTLLLLLAGPMQAADPMTRYLAQPGSKVTIKGSNTVHDCEVQGQVLDGWIEFGTGFPITSGQEVTLGKMPARLEGSLPVRSLHNVSEGATMDQAMYHTLKEPAHPRIFFRFSEMILKALPKSKDAAYRCDCVGELVVAGVTNRISMPVAVLPRGGNQLKITGNTSVKMSDFGIQPPEMRGADFIVRTADEVQLSFEMVGRQPAD